MSATELDGFGNTVPVSEIVCAGLCRRRGPQFKVVPPEEVTCRDCLVIMTGDPSALEATFPGNQTPVESGSSAEPVLKKKESW